MRSSRVLGALLLGFLGAQANVALAGERWVVQFKEPASVQQQRADQTGRVNAYEARRFALAARMQNLSKVHKQPFDLIRPFGDQGAVVRFSGSSTDAQQALQRLRSDPAVLSVELDRRIRLNAQSPLIGVLNGLDPFLRARSWFHQDLASQPVSINTSAMWANFHGTAPTVVAVLDTGVLPGHPMLQGHLLPGYDFVADPFMGADGQGNASSSRDSDPTDPGDGVDALDIAGGLDCSVFSRSSWHGTFVSGLVAGNPVVSEGIFSVNQNAAVLPVRVLGKCGGFSSDLADGIRWAAGLNVPGAPTNPFPARVINLSLGADGACVAGIEGAAIAAARQAGALVVVATGNEGGAVDSPANCPGAFAVAAVDQEGLKANYSNFGSSVQLVGPGGDAAFPIWSASNTGIRAAGLNTYDTKVGTSFSAPMVAAAASLYWSLNPSATVQTVEAALRNTSRPFLNLPSRPACNTALSNTECNCTSGTCGAGMLDVARLVSSVSAGGLTNLFSNTGSVIPPGQTRRFFSTGTLNSVGAEVSSVSFDVINVQKSDPAANDPVLVTEGLQVDVTAPTSVSGFDLRAQAASGRTAIVSVVVTNSAPTSPTLLASLLSPLINSVSTGAVLPGVVVVDGPVGDSASQVSTAGGGGGGGFSALWLVALFSLLFVYKQSAGQSKYRHLWEIQR